jgi:hypothetical protein
MLSVGDGDRHGAGQTRQFPGAGVRHHGDGQLRRATRHRAAVLQGKCAAAAVQSSGDLLDRDVAGRALDAGHGGQHLAFAGGLQAAMKLFVDGHPADARGFGIRRLGNQLYLKCSKCMHPLLQDFRYALRMLRKSPGMTIVIVLSLAIGIGANSAVFSVVDALMLRPLPYPQPERLAAIWLHSPGIGIFRDWPSPGQYIDIQNENHSFEEMSISRLTSFTLTGLDQPQRIDGMRTSSGLLHMLGARPLLGRVLLPEEDKPGKPPVAILSYNLWKRLFNSDAKVIGRSITLNGNQVTVAGVLRPEFRLNSEVMPAEGPMDKVDIFLPLPLGADAVQRAGTRTTT